jgi:hypothetical protein
MKGLEPGQAGHCCCGLLVPSGTGVARFVEEGTGVAVETGASVKMGAFMVVTRNACPPQYGRPLQENVKRNESIVKFNGATYEKFPLEDSKRDSAPKRGPAVSK